MKKILANIDKKLLLFSTLLFILGLLVVLSASSVTAYARYNASPINFFLKQSLFLVMGFCLTIFAIRIPTKKYKYWGWFGIVVISFILFALLVWGIAVNDTVGWIGYKGFGIQPSEFTKLIMIVWIAIYFEKFKSKLDDFRFMIIPILVGMFVTVLVALQNDYGTASIIAFLVFFMFCISPVSKKIKKPLIIFAVISVMTLGGVLIGLTVSGSDLLNGKLERFNIIDPCSRYQDSGNQICNGYIAINGSEGIGKGLGNSTQKFLYLPEAHTDFIYAIYVEELGLIGASLLMLGYIIVLGRILAIGRKTDNDFNAMICYGVAAMVFIHIFINLCGLLGIIPLTGVPLPFMSYGGSFTITVIVGLALVQRINYEANIKIKKGINIKKR